MNSPSSPRTTARSTWLAVLLILLLAAGTRIIGAAQQVVWTDEGTTQWIASDFTDWDTFKERVTEWDRHSPMYALLLVGWREVAGDSRLALRFWAIMSGIIATALVYRIGADWRGAAVGRYAALLFAVLAIAVIYGRAIRGYGWLIMAECATTFFFLRYLRHPRPIWLIGFALSIALILYTVFSGIVILGVMGLITLLWRGTWRHKFALLGAVGAGVALFTPWLIVVIDQYERMKVGIEGAPGTYATTGDNLLLLAEFIWGEQLALMLGVWLLGMVGVAAAFLPGYFLALIPAPSPSGRREQPHTARLFPPRPEGEGVQGVRASTQTPTLTAHDRLAGLLLILSGGGLFIFMMLWNLHTPVVAARTLVFVVPFVMLICAYGLTRIPAPVRDIFTALIVGLSLVSVPVIQPRLAYDDVARTFAADYARGDLIILETGWDDMSFEYEMRFELPADATFIRTLPWVDPGHIEPVIPRIEPVITDYDRVWVVQWLQESQVIPWLEPADQGFIRVLRRTVSIGDEYLDHYPFYPTTVQMVLYERIDQPIDPLQFGEVLTLRNVIVGDTVGRGDALHVDLWWSAVAEMERDYSVGVYLMPLDTDQVIAQHDGPPAGAQTSAWTPGQHHFDRHTLTVPRDLAAGTYRVVLRVYWFQDGVPLQVAGGDLATVGTIEVD